MYSALKGTFNLSETIIQRQYIVPPLVEANEGSISFVILDLSCPLTLAGEVDDQLLPLEV